MFPYPGTLDAAGDVVKKAIEIERVKARASDT